MVDVVSPAFDHGGPQGHPFPLQPHLREDATYEEAGPEAGGGAPVSMQASPFSVRTPTSDVKLTSRAMMSPQPEARNLDRLRPMELSSAVVDSRDSGRLSSDGGAAINISSHAGDPNENASVMSALRQAMVPSDSDGEVEDTVAKSRQRVREHKQREREAAMRGHEEQARRRQEIEAQHKERLRRVDDDRRKHLLAKRREEDLKKVHAEESHRQREERRKAQEELAQQEHRKVQARLKASKQREAQQKKEQEDREAEERRKLNEETERKAAHAQLAARRRLVQQKRAAEQQKAEQETIEAVEKEYDNDVNQGEKAEELRRRAQGRIQQKMQLQKLQERERKAKMEQEQQKREAQQEQEAQELQARRELAAKRAADRLRREHSEERKARALKEEAERLAREKKKQYRNPQLIAELKQKEPSAMPLAEEMARQTRAKRRAESEKLRRYGESRDQEAGNRAADPASGGRPPLPPHAAGGRPSPNSRSSASPNARARASSEGPASAGRRSGVEAGRSRSPGRSPSSNAPLSPLPSPPRSDRGNTSEADDEVLMASPPSRSGLDAELREQGGTINPEEQDEDVLCHKSSSPVSPTVQTDDARQLSPDVHATEPESLMGAVESADKIQEFATQQDEDEAAQADEEVFAEGNFGELDGDPLQDADDEQAAEEGSMEDTITKAGLAAMADGALSICGVGFSNKNTPTVQSSSVRRGAQGNAQASHEPRAKFPIKKEPLLQDEDEEEEEEDEGDADRLGHADDEAIASVDFVQERNRLERELNELKQLESQQAMWTERIQTECEAGASSLESGEALPLDRDSKETCEEQCDGASPDHAGGKEIFAEAEDLEEKAAIVLQAHQRGRKAREEFKKRLADKEEQAGDSRDAREEQSDADSPHHAEEEKVLAEADLLEAHAQSKGSPTEGEWNSALENARRAAGLQDVEDSRQEQDEIDPSETAKEEVFAEGDFGELDDAELQLDEDDALAVEEASMEDAIARAGVAALVEGALAVQGAACEISGGETHAESDVKGNDGEQSQLAQDHEHEAGIVNGAGDAASEAVDEEHEPNVELNAEAQVAGSPKEAAQLAEELQPAEVPRKDNSLLAEAESTDEPQPASEPRAAGAPKEESKPAEETRTAEVSTEGKPVVAAEPTQESKPFPNPQPTETPTEKSKLTDDVQAAEEPTEDATAIEPVSMEECNLVAEPLATEAPEEENAPAQTKPTDEIELTAERQSSDVLQEEAEVAEQRQTAEVPMDDEPVVVVDSAEESMPAAEPPTEIAEPAEEPLAEEAPMQDEHVAGAELTEESKPGVEPQAADASEEEAEPAEEPVAPEASTEDQIAIEAEPAEESNLAAPQAAEVPSDVAKPTEGPLAAEAPKENEEVVEADSTEESKPAVEPQAAEASGEEAEPAVEPVAAEAPTEDKPATEGNTNDGGELPCRSVLTPTPAFESQMEDEADADPASVAVDRQHSPRSLAQVGVFHDAPRWSEVLAGAVEPGLKPQHSVDSLKDCGEGEIKLDEAETSTVDPATASAGPTLPSSPGESNLETPTAGDEITRPRSSSERPPYRRNQPPPPIITSETPRTARGRTSDQDLQGKISNLSQFVPSVSAAVAGKAEDEESDLPFVAVAPEFDGVEPQRTPMPTLGSDAPHPSQHTPMPNAQGLGSKADPNAAQEYARGLLVNGVLNGKLADALDTAMDAAPESDVRHVVPPEGNDSVTEQDPSTYPSSARDAHVELPIAGLADDAESLYPVSARDAGARAEPQEKSADAAPPLVTTADTPASAIPHPLSRQRSPASRRSVASVPPAQSSRPASRPPAGSRSSSRPGSRSEQTRPSPQPVPLGADPLSAFAASRQQANSVSTSSLPAAPQPTQAPSSAEAPHRKRAKSSQPIPRTAQSAEPPLRRAGSVESPRSKRSSGGKGQAPLAPLSTASPSRISSSPPPPPAPGWMSAGDEGFANSMTETLRRRAQKVTADQMASEKEREDSLLRMLDNRQQQRQRAVL